MWAIGRRGWAAIRSTRVSLPAGVSRALACAMRPPVSAVPSDSPHLTRRPHLTSTTSMGRTASRRPLEADAVHQVTCRLTNLLGQPAVLVDRQAVAGPVEQ